MISSFVKYVIFFGQFYRKRVLNRYILKANASNETIH